MRQAAAGDADHLEEAAEKFSFYLRKVSVCIAFSSPARRRGSASRVYFFVFLPGIRWSFSGSLEEPA
jgi:hypothetical protein